MMIPQVKDCLVVLAFILSDIVIGLVKAITTHSYTSEIMREGLFHKLGEILCFIFGVLCDTTLPNFGVIVPFSLARSIAVYITIMEIGSVIENIGIINPELEKYLGKVFVKVREAAQVEEPEEPKETGIEDNGNKDI